MKFKLKYLVILLGAAGLALNHGLLRADDPAEAAEKKDSGSAPEALPPAPSAASSPQAKPETPVPAAPAAPAQSAAEQPTQKTEPPAPPAATAPPAAPPSPTSSKSLPSTCLKHAEGVVPLYEKKTQEMKAFMEKSSAKLLAMVGQEKDSQLEINSTIEEMAKLSGDPKKNKKEISRLKKQSDKLKKQLKEAKTNTAKTCVLIAQELGEVNKNILEDLKDAVREVQKKMTTPEKEVEP